MFSDLIPVNLKNLKKIFLKYFRKKDKLKCMEEKKMQVFKLILIIVYFSVGIVL